MEGKRDERIKSSAELGNERMKELVKTRPYILGLRVTN